MAKADSKHHREETELVTGKGLKYSVVAFEEVGETELDTGVARLVFWVGREGPQPQGGGGDLSVNDFLRSQWDSENTGIS
jgi:hypothetical protein